MLSPISGSSEDLNVRRPLGSVGYLFGRGNKKIQAKEELLQDVIYNIEANGEFIIYASIRLISSRAGALFSISHSQRKLLLLDLSAKGMGSTTKLILRYRSTSDSAENVIFKDLNVLGDRKHHTIILHISDVMEDNGNKISSVTLYVDCKPFGKAETVSPISSIFSYKGTLLSRLEFRIAQRGFGKKIHTQWGVSILFTIISFMEGQGFRVRQALILRPIYTVQFLSHETCIQSKGSWCLGRKQSHTKKTIFRSDVYS